MKNYFRGMTAALAALFLCPVAGSAAGPILHNDTMMPIPQPLSYSTTFYMRTHEVGWASAETVMTSAPWVAAGYPFDDGTISTGSFTVGAFAKLSTAAATGSLTVLYDTMSVVGTIVSGGGPGLGNFTLTNGQQWTTDVNYATNTACSLANAMNTYNTYGVVIATCNSTSSSGVIYTTAPVGAAWNAFTINVATLAFTTSQFSGGQDNAYVIVNGNKLVANTDWFPVTSNNATATSIATAINKSSPTYNVAAQAVSAVVATSATFVGTIPNSYQLVTSSYGALSTSSPTVLSMSGNPWAVAGSSEIGTTHLWGGTTAAYTINTSTIIVSYLGTAALNPLLGVGQAVYISTSNGIIINPLKANVTYYAIPVVSVSTNAFMLSLTSTGAIAGLPIVLTSSQTNTTSDVFTLNTVANVGTPVMNWLVSNDAVNWVTPTTTSLGQTIGGFGGLGTYYSTGTVTTQDFGHFDYGFLGVNVGAPTAGAIVVQQRIITKSP